MKCPFCGKEMESGYIPSTRDPLRWLPSGEVEMFMPSERRVRLYYPMNHIGADRGAEAYYCADCRRVVVNVPPQKERLVDRLFSRKKPEADTSEEHYAEQWEDPPKSAKKKNWDKDPWED